MQAKKEKEGEKLTHTRMPFRNRAIETAIGYAIVLEAPHCCHVGHVALKAFAYKLCLLELFLIDLLQKNTQCV